MRRKRGEGRNPSGETGQRPPQDSTWIDRVAAAPRRESGHVAVPAEMLARLERFGLAMTGEPLLELKRERS